MPEKLDCIIIKKQNKKLFLTNDKRCHNHPEDPNT